MTKKLKIKTFSIPRNLKLRPEQVHKPAKAYNRKKEKLKLQKAI